MPEYDTGCLYSKVKNISGAPMYFAYLPPHGRRLAAGQVLTIFGNILEIVARSQHRGALEAMERDVANRRLEIVQLPTPIIADSADGTPAVLKVTGAAVAAVAPCWETSLSF